MQTSKAERVYPANVVLQDMVTEDELSDDTLSVPKLTHIDLW